VRSRYVVASALRSNADYDERDHRKWREYGYHDARG